MLNVGMGEAILLMVMCLAPVGLVIGGFFVYRAMSRAKAGRPPGPNG